jgi:hypothetical protein
MQILGCSSPLSLFPRVLLWGDVVSTGTLPQRSLEQAPSSELLPPAALPLEEF